MRRTETLRLFVIDRSVLAQNMYRLLFENFPGFQIEYGENAAGLVERQRRGRPHVVIANSNAFEGSQDTQDHKFMSEYPTILLVPPDRTDLKELARQQENVTLIEKPFYPYDLLTAINRIAGIHHPVKLSKEARKAHGKKVRRRPRKKALSA